MDKPNKSTTSRSSSRSKRSATNLSDLRLAPLSSRYSEPRKRRGGMKSPRSPREESLDVEFVRSHSSYLQGKSAPTTPGILSRSSSRRHLGGGLSRRGSLYENDGPEAVAYEYAGVVRDDAGGVRVDVGSGQIPKAKSDAALLVRRSKLAGQGKPSMKRQYHHQAGIRTGGSTTPVARSKPKGAEDDWLTRTGAAANAMLQESKGQSWLSSRESSTTLSHLQDTTDEEDEGYEEMAALSSSTNRLQLADDEQLSPVSTKASRWGSRYGSRTASRRTSRRGSVTGSRTPLAPTVGNPDAIAGYFDEDPLAIPTGPDFVDADEANESHDEETVTRLTENRSFGLGTIVDRLMNFNLFKVEEKEESTDDDASETEAEAKERMEAENQRKREEKERLVNVNPPAQRDGGEGAAQGEGGWSDAAWLLSVASKAVF